MLYLLFIPNISVLIYNKFVHKEDILNEDEKIMPTIQLQKFVVNIVIKMFYINRVGGNGGPPFT